MTSVYSETKLLFRIAIDLLAYLEYTHTFKLVKVNNPSLNLELQQLCQLQYTHTFKLVKVKVNNPSLNHAKTFVQPTFSFEAATLYESTKMKKENMVPYVQEAWRGKKSYIESSH